MYRFKRYVGQLAAKVTVVAAVSLMLLACGDGENRQEKYLERAQTFFDEQNFDKARIEAQNVLQINPKNSDARFLMGELAMADGNVRKAYGFYLSVLEENAEHINSNLALAKLLILARDFDRSFGYVETILAVDPDHLDALAVKSQLYFQTEEVEKGKIIAQKVLEVDKGNVIAVNLLVQDYLSNNEQHKALDLVNDAIEVNPKGRETLARMKLGILQAQGDKDGMEKELIALTETFPERQVYKDSLVQFYVEEQKFNRAEQTLRNYVETNPENVEAKIAIVSHLFKHKSKESAIEEVNRLMAENSDEGKYGLALAQIHIFSNELDEAKKVLNGVIDSNPRSVSSINARNAIISMHIQAEELDAAQGLIAEILSIEPENSTALITRARLNFQNQAYKDVIADMRTILRNEPENVAALRLLAVSQERDDSQDLALDNYRKLVALNSKDAKTLGAAARLAIRNKNYEEAEQYIRMALASNANDPALVTNLIGLLVIKDDISTALTFADGLIESEESKALGYFLKGSLQSRQENYDEGIESLEKSLSVEPRAIETISTLTQVLQKSKGNDAALKFVKAHCDKNEDLAECHYVLGTLYAQEKDFDGAITELKKALSLNEKLVTAYQQLAKVYLFKQSQQDAAATLKEGAAITGNAGLSFDLAAVYYQMEDFNATEKVYLSMLDVDADNLPVKNNLAMLYADKLQSDENLQKARGLIADLQDSEAPVYLDTVGWVFYRAGDYAQAVTYLRSAVQKVEASRLLQYHLGMALYKVGSIEEAKEHLSLAVKNPEQPYDGIAEAQATLESL